MNTLFAALASSTLAISAPVLTDNQAMAGAGDMHGTFRNPAYIFKMADTNGDGYLDKMEYSRYRMHTTDKKSVNQYRSDTRENMGVMIDRDFAAIDRDNNDWISRDEFMAVARMSGQAGEAADIGYSPYYMTITYYLRSTPVNADYFEGREVINLEGHSIGKIDNIIRVNDGENAGTYALIDIDGPHIYRPTRALRDQVGIPLDDLLLFDKQESIMLSSRGEEELRNVDAPEIDEYDDVDTLYTLS